MIQPLISAPTSSSNCEMDRPSELRGTLQFTNSNMLAEKESVQPLPRWEETLDITTQACMFGKNGPSLTLPCLYGSNNRQDKRTSTDPHMNCSIGSLFDVGKTQHSRKLDLACREARASEETTRRQDRTIICDNTGNARELHGSRKWFNTWN